MSFVVLFVSVIILEQILVCIMYSVNLFIYIRQRSLSICIRAFSLEVDIPGIICGPFAQSNCPYFYTKNRKKNIV